MIGDEQKQINLEDVLITSELSRRSPKIPDFQAENQALHTLARQLAESPETMLKTLVAIARDLCQAGTTGVSLLEVSSSGEEVFRWVAMAGELAQYEQATIPGNFSPCGVCLESGSPQLYFYPERYFTYFQQAQPAIIESLIIPLVLDEQPLGTIWIVSHDEQRQFDSEDVRMMTSLASMSAAALQSSRARQTAVDAQQALQKSQAQMQSLLANMPGMVYRYIFFADGLDRFTFVNSGCCDLFEVEPSAVLQDTGVIWNQIHPDDRSSFQASVATAVENSLPWDWQGRIITPSGKLKWIQGKSSALRTADGDFWDGWLIDITERKQIEEALRESEELKQRIIQSSNDCIKVLTLDAHILYLSAGGQRLLEIEDPALILNSDWTHFWQGEDDEQAQAVIAAARMGDVGRFQGYCPTVKGKPKWWDVIVTPIRDASGQVVQLLSISRDITVAKQIEIEREQILQREQSAREAAERANQIKDEFLAVLSHELRSPLNPILGWSTLLRSGKLDAAKTAAAIEIIERNAKLQVQLIEDLLDVSRILRAKFSLNMVGLNLASTIKAAMETVQLAAQAKSVRVETVFEKDVGQILGDSARLQQIIWNLLSNAVKFTPTGGSVQIQLNRMGEQAQIQVRDTGIGISPDFLPHVFEYFRQANSTTTRTFGGLGLGLAIVRHLVELHGGTVHADSPGVGQGATFTVRIPLLKDEGDRRLDESTSSSLIGSSSSLPLADLRVLLVDDEKDSRDLIAFVLEESGALVTSTPNAISALQTFKQTNFDVLISDIGMAEMDGYMLMQQIRAMTSFQGREIVAIALTAYAGEINQQHAISAGFQRHITKPVEPEDLVKVITDLIKQTKLSNAG
ncbi:MAG: ATP-binding protein [Rhizonema sp. NSF051]|nr:ATP-binding protein [Rhizonema sp. NSF051]